MREAKHKLSNSGATIADMVSHILLEGGRDVVAGPVYARPNDGIARTAAGKRNLPAFHYPRLARSLGKRQVPKQTEAKPREGVPGEAKP